MLIYILLLFLIFIAKIIELAFPQFKRGQLTLGITMFVVFLLLALKGNTVGIDISGYRDQYILAKSVSWGNYDYVYFENGYIFLMKLFAKSGFSFQTFLIICYAFSCLAMYLFIRRYSCDGWLSVIIFICNQFFVFYISGIRQMLGMSICICAFLVLDGKHGKGWLRTFFAVLLLFVAAQIHESAYIFSGVLLLYFFRRYTMQIWVPVIAILAAVLIKNNLVSLILSIFHVEAASNGLSLGKNFLMLLILFVIAYYGRRQDGASSAVILGESLIGSDMAQSEQDMFDNLSLAVLLLAICSELVFEGTTLLRASMYLTLFMIVGIPNLLRRYEWKLYVILDVLVILVMLYIFVFTALKTNQLNMYPYVFFWQ